MPFLVHLLCTVVVGNLEVRQKLLEEDEVLDRGGALLTILETFRQELGRGRLAGSGDKGSSS